MSATSSLSNLLIGVRRRCAAVVLLRVFPLAVLLAAATWRVAGDHAAWMIAALALAAMSGWAWRRCRRLDARWLVRRLDSVRADMEDSAELLLLDATVPTSLASLQRARLAERLLAVPTPDLRERWPLAQLALLWVLALPLSFALLRWPVAAPPPHTTAVASSSREAAAPAHTYIASQQLHVMPPAYTGLAAFALTTLDARVPERARVRWSLRLQPEPATAALRFHDGSTLLLHREGDSWQGEREVSEGLLYRLDVGNAATLEQDLLYRLDVQPDLAPEIRVSVPEHTLTVLEAGQHEWRLQFEASDDYGLGAAQLQLTLAQGSGENVRFSERQLSLRGSGNATHKRFAHRIDLAALGFAIGDDLVLRIAISDNRQPSANRTRHPSFILRWPPAASAEATGLEGMVQRTLPAYFRSQRQIIIDSEALLAERPQMPAPRFVDRADAIGVDQRILRLRYGQFLGEETEVPQAPDAAHANDDDHGHDDGDIAARPGDDQAVLEQYGHTHDHAEAATLFDPRTRALLKAALDAMWQSEGQLRQGQVQAALPHQYRALDFIKQVQQASRIYLSRVGLELPPIDLARRLSGDRSGLRDRNDPMQVANVAEQPVAAVWALTNDALTQAQGTAALGALSDWVNAQGARLPDRLALLAAIEPLRRDPDCVPCVATLRKLLWPLLPTPAANVRWRDAPDLSGNAYLDALDAPAAGEPQ